MPRKVTTAVAVGLGIATLTVAAIAAQPTSRQLEDSYLEVAKGEIQLCGQSGMISQCDEAIDSLEKARAEAASSGGTSRLSGYDSAIANTRAFRQRVAAQLAASSAVHRSSPAASRVSTATGPACAFSGKTSFYNSDNNPSGQGQIWQVAITNHTRRNLFCGVTAAAPVVMGGEQGHYGEYQDFAPGQTITFSVPAASGEGHWNVSGCRANKALDRTPNLPIGHLNVCHGDIGTVAAVGSPDDASSCLTYIPVGGEFKNSCGYSVTYWMTYPITVGERDRWGDIRANSSDSLQMGGYPDEGFYVACRTDNPACQAAFSKVRPHFEQNESYATAQMLAREAGFHLRFGFR